MCIHINHRDQPTLDFPFFFYFRMNKWYAHMMLHQEKKKLPKDSGRPFSYDNSTNKKNKMAASYKQCFFCVFCIELSLHHRHFVIYRLLKNGANKNQHQESHQRETIQDKFAFFFQKLGRQKVSRVTRKRVCM